MGNVLVPGALAVAIVVGRALTHNHRAPYPYEMVSTGIVFAGCGLVGEMNPTLGSVAAWAYVVALLLQPKSSNLLGTIAGGLKSA